MKTLLEDKLAKIEELPLISTFLPYKFGGSTIRDVEITCAFCGADVPSDAIRGEFKTVTEGQSAHMTAYALCFKCKTVSPVVSKFHGDGVVLTKVNDGWVQDVWTTEKAGVGIFKNIHLTWQQVVPPLIAALVAAAWVVRNGI